jgi:riboflavin kinase / FMN adenylyltransferase
MLVAQRFDQIDQHAPSVCCVGTFDGVHLGHQQLIRSAVHDAHARGVAAVVVTFFPSPRVFLGRAEPRYLTLPEDKAALISALGVDTLLIHPFDRETMRTPAAVFVEHLLRAFQMRALWMGPDFALGHNREGDAAYLTRQGAQLGFDVHVAPQLSLGDRPVSSSRIRAALAAGDVREANQCLGRPYRVPCLPQADGRLCVDAQRLLPAPGRYRTSLGDMRADAVVDAGDCGVTLIGQPPLLTHAPTPLAFLDALSTPD